MWKRLVLAAMTLLAAAAAAASVTAAETPTFKLSIKNHRFSPPTLTIPAGKRVLLLVDNADPTPEEFESFELNREKVVPGHSTGKVYIGPLDPGTYPFFGDFHQATAQGRVIAK